MVVPLGAGGPEDGINPAAMLGPPPPELQPRFRRIKACLVALTGSIVFKLISGTLLIPTNAFGYLYNSLNAILNMIIGIFLLKDDPLVAPAHRCITRTCCSGCEDQCQGGMSCLCTWFFCCMITAVFGLLPVDGSDLMTVIVGFRLILNPHLAEDTKWWLPVRSAVWFAMLALFTLATTVGLLAQIIGGWQGMKGFQEVQMLEPQGGNWSMGRGGLDGLGGGPATAGGMPPSGGPPQGFREPPPSSAGGGQAVGGRAAGPQQGFTPFAGTGQRLGG